MNIYMHTLTVDPSTAEWSTTIQDHPRQQFTQPMGPKEPIPDSPSEIFGLFFTPEILGYIVEETNRYAEQMMTPAQLLQWKPLTVEELKANMGFCILIGIVKEPALEDYLKKDPIFHYAPIASKISGERFRDIRRYLHFRDNTTIPAPGTPGSDRLAKIRPIIDMINKRCDEVYDLGRDICIDEAMIKFQGRSALNQYLPKKPIKRGIKVWVLADSENGYFHTMQVYKGKENTPEKHLGSRVVKDLAAPLKNKYHHVYFDNFFSSVGLLEDLRDVQKGNVTVSAWMDNKVVRVMSTALDATQMTSVQRRQRSGEKVPVSCPQSINDYNRKMGGVDNGDQKRQHYRCPTKFRKFYMYICSFLKDVCITNAYILHKQHSPNPKYKTMLEFRTRLAIELIGDYCSRKRPGCQ